MFTSLTQRFDFNDLPYSVQEALQAIVGVFVVAGLILKFITRTETYLGVVAVTVACALPVWAFFGVLGVVGRAAGCGYCG
ncbi:hypothetical protein ACG04R_16430 [Roseateles sp. BYS78W]|uniref:Uncharacterized protein n=1 Tax=Pelomonas candidula TaxID=3299025 RepID=A0ABW7HEN1_9BURK